MFHRCIIIFIYICPFVKINIDVKASMLEKIRNSSTLNKSISLFEEKSELFRRGKWSRTVLDPVHST